MPDSKHNPANKQGNGGGLLFQFPVSEQGPHEKIIMKPGRQGCMKSFPEIRHVLGKKWPVKIHGDLNPEGPGKANGNIGISGKIEIEIEW